MPVNDNNSKYDYRILVQDLKFKDLKKQSRQSVWVL